MTVTPQGDVLLTGATGFVGMELLARYLQRGERDVVTLVRADNHAAAQARVDAVLANLFGAEAAALPAACARGGRRHDRSGPRAHRGRAHRAWPSG